MTDTNSFQAADICAILDSCNKNNVKTFKLGNLEIAFETVSAPASTDLSFVNQPVGEANLEAKADVNIDLTELPDHEKVSLIGDLRMAQLMTDDPVAYEQEMIDANLNKQAVQDALEINRRFEPDL